MTTIDSISDIYLNKEQFENVFKKHIKTSVYSLSIKSLFGERMLRKMDYSPYYQRNYVWDNAKASFFIESVLLGTDIPPLILFNNGSKMEVIDGRQRFETIKRFREGDLKLNIKGLSKLTQLKNHTFGKLSSDIQDIFDDAKIRIFEFEVINQPNLEEYLEDKIKKEIFRRYNSGITPLNSAEIDNATYDDDEITNRLKILLPQKKSLITNIGKKFLNKQLDGFNSNSATVLQFMRKYLVLSSFPIRTYASGSSRSEIMTMLYDVRSENTENVTDLCEILFNNLNTTFALSNSFFDKSIADNKFINECLLWAISILNEEKISIESLFEKKNVKKIEKYLSKNINHFTSEQSHYYTEIITRHKSTATIIGEITGFDFRLFIRDDSFKNTVKKMRQSESEAKLKLDELSSLRVQKPEPSVVPVYDITDDLRGSRYLVRPSYQRQERINVFKASAIIESILLGITLPPIFVFKRINGVKEVIDGQQRLLSILGYMGKQYQDETGKLVYPKKCNYKLTRLKILKKDFEGKTYSDLHPSLQDKILDFKLSVIEIDESLNGNFEPVDLFIRLNNKPYPIKDNSFEMWNSFMDKEIIQSIKTLTNDNIDWFFIKRRNRETSPDRMLNEELITLLSYIHYNGIYRPDYKSIGFYSREESITCRIGDKKDVSNLLERISTDIELKNHFQASIYTISEGIKYLKSLLGSTDLSDNLNSLFNLEKKRGSKRYLVDFYILMQLIVSAMKKNDGVTNVTYKDISDKLLFIQTQLKTPPDMDGNKEYQEYFMGLLKE